MKKQILSLGFSAILCLQTLPVNAQVAITHDPLLAAQQTAQNSIALAEAIKQTTHAVEQLQKWQEQLDKLQKQYDLGKEHLQAFKDQISYDRIQVPDDIKKLSKDLGEKISKNLDMMTATTALDQKMNTEFIRIVPGYKPGQDYTYYVALLNKNTTKAHAQTLGIANDAVTSEALVSEQVKKIDITKSDNPLQALQQLIQLGKISTEQMNKLIKIQAAMTKSMVVSYQANGGGGGGNGTGAIGSTTSSFSVESYCTSRYPLYAMSSGAAREQQYAECKKSMDTAAALAATPIQ